jgi:hypothetical protein
MTLLQRSVTLSAALILAVVPPAFGQRSPDENLRTCLTGQYPALCNHSLLVPHELRWVQGAERRENLRTCLTGRYPALCRHSMLTQDELRQVREAERRENLETCKTGRYPALCKHELLSPSELRLVTEAERRENLKVCLEGGYPALCKHSLLTSDESRRVKEAEYRAASVRPKKPASRPRRGDAGSCERGHWIDWVSDDGDVIKLEDGSVWEIDSADAVMSAIWLPVSQIVACDGKLINVDDGESVNAMRIR